ncbi:hypothetical protein LWI29_010015 [Acer saccharum]|uniref:Uncharacterized protein n=1 Tax=Acer saccharum TaxID=4024 RepID=A0AA39SJF1_ACESA|nr:hypothetical protein LWI29_010015 [Acer saccharum]
MSAKYSKKFKVLAFARTFVDHKSEETRAGDETKRNSLPFSALPPPQPFSTTTNRCFTFISWYNLCHEFE